MAQPIPSALSSAPRAHALRLRPGDDLREALLAYVAQHAIKAGAVLTCVGSLTVAALRLANHDGPTEYRGHFEIVSLVGPSWLASRSAATVRLPTQVSTAPAFMACCASPPPLLN
ncbi:MAG: DNA-binding protein [Hymenobacter sp.]|nr:MAG: DNA-binding protein [Hymenobacter sp.]